MHVELLLLLSLCSLYHALPQADDPFFEDPTTPVLIGTVNLFMQSLCYKMNSEEHLTIIDYRSQEMGQ